MRLGSARGWCPRTPRRGGPGGRGGGGSQAGEKSGGDYSPHMDATPKGPPVPPTPDILSPLSRRGISDLSVAAPRCALQRHRIPRPLPSFVHGGNRRTRRTPLSPSPSSPTCLDLLLLLRPLRLAAEGSLLLPTSRLLRVLGAKRRPRGSSVAAGSETIPRSGDPARRRLEPPVNPAARAEGNFFTRVFTPRRLAAFDAYFTRARAEQRRAVGRPLRLTAAVLRVGHIDRFRPQAPNSRLQPKTLREQCRAALPRGLCKVSDHLFSLLLGIFFSFSQHRRRHAIRVHLDGTRLTSRVATLSRHR